MEVIHKYFKNLSAQQEQQFEQLLDLYTHWNAQINVVSRKDIDQLNTRHVLHSLAIAKVISFKAGTQILDVGTGGGFPGIPLAILFPECQFHLVDSIGKKIKVVNEVTNALDLKNVKASHSRAEDIEGKFDFIVSRAVTRLEPFYSWIKNKIKSQDINALPNGLLALKGGDLSEEIKIFKGKYQSHEVEEFNISDWFEEAFFETKKVIYVS